MAESVLAFIRAGMAALQRTDAPELRRLTEAAVGLRRPATAAERESAARRLRDFELFLVLTRRNLRLLRGTHGQWNGYGPPEQ